jgi:hypothetical protein
MEDVTQEEIDNYLKEKEEREIESKRLDKKLAEYKKKIKDGNFSLTIDWETDITKINLNTLKTSLIEDIKNRLVSDYSIVWLDLDKVVALVSQKPDSVFPKDNLWKRRQPETIARVIEFIEEKNKIIPALIQPVDKNTLAIIDGNHRIALCRFLKLDKIPFIVENKYLLDINDLK